MAEATAVPQRPRHGRTLLRWAAIAAAGLLAACQTVVPRGVEPAPARPAARPAPPVAPQVEVGLPRDEARSRVALLVPLTGSNAGLGQSIANATMLALLDTQTRSVRITNYDTAGVGGAAGAAQRAVAEGAQLILGPLLADDARAVAPVARAARVPVISFSNDTGVAGGGTYLMGYIPAQSVERVVEFAAGRGVTTFAGLVPNGLYGERASTAFLRAVEGARGQVVSLQTYGRTTGGVAAAAQRLVAKAPYGAVLVADAGPIAAAAATVVKRGSGAATRLLGTELWNSENGLAARPALAGAWYASVSNTLYRQYAVKYRSRFGTAPYRLSSLGYDSVLLTVRIARDWRPGTPFPEARLRDADGFSGIDGAFRFTRDGVAERALEVQEVRGGTIVTVSAAPTGFGR